MTEPMEPVLEPGLRIVDAHHHLMDGPGHRYTIDDYAADCALGHDIRASVYIEVRQHYRDGGPEHLRPVGETEFVSSLAERAERGAWGGRRLCAGIVGYADLAIGDRAGEVLDAHIEAGGGRFKGIRRGVYWDADEAVYGQTTTFTALWNAFKRLTGGCSDDEKRLLYRENANRAYRLGLET